MTDQSVHIFQTDLIGGVASSRLETENGLGAIPRPRKETRDSSTVLQIKALPFYMVQLTDNISSWQGYWHEDKILPAETQRKGPITLSAKDYHSLQQETEKLVKLANATSLKSAQILDTEHNISGTSSPQLLLQLAEFMKTYHDELIAQLELFPNTNQQRALFGAMLRMTKGNLERDSDTGRTLLHWFAMNDIHCLIPKLVELGFDVNDRDSDYRTPLHLAVVSNNYWSVEALVNECHADPNVEDLCRMLPWHLALAIDDDNVVENAERTHSKAEIISYLARHTDASKIKGKRSLKILEKLRDNPSAEIVFTLPRGPRSDAI